jgi:hypothetical protein
VHTHAVEFPFGDAFASVQVRAARRVAVGEAVPEPVGDAVVESVGDVVVDAVALGVAEPDAVAALERVGGAVPFVDGAAERVAVCDTSEAPPLG